MLFYTISGFVSFNLPADQMPNRLVSSTIDFTQLPEPSGVLAAGLAVWMLLGRQSRSFCAITTGKGL